MVTSKDERKSKPTPPAQPKIPESGPQAPVQQIEVTNNPRTLPAFISNRFYMFVNSESARICFGEVVDGVLTYHYSVTLSLANAKEMNEMLAKFISKYETK